MESEWNKFELASYTMSVHYSKTLCSNKKRTHTDVLLTEHAFAFFSHVCIYAYIHTHIMCSDCYNTVFSKTISKTVVSDFDPN